MRIRPRSLLAMGAAALAVASTLASTYGDRRAAAMRECEAIDPSRYQSGLYFNPEGYRSFYLRSECFQRVAIRFRDPALCAQVRQRRAVMSSSWGYSERNCRTLVAAGIAKDRGALEDMRRGYLASHMTLRDFRIELNNNGRDFDIVPIVSGTTGHGYTLRFEVLPGSGAPILLHTDGYWVDASTLRIYVTRPDVQQRLPDLSPERRYAVRATMTFSVPSTTGDAEWSELFLESVFPLRERTQTTTKTIVFPVATIRR